MFRLIKANTVLFLCFFWFSTPPLFSQGLHLPPSGGFDVTVNGLKDGDPISDSEVSARVKLRLRKNNVPYSLGDTKVGELLVTLKFMELKDKKSKQKTGDYAFSLELSFGRYLSASNHQTPVWAIVWGASSIGYSPGETISELILPQLDGGIDLFSVEFLEENNF